MPSIEQCSAAFHSLAGRLSAADGSTRRAAQLDRTISCTLHDPDVVFAGRLAGGELIDIRRVEDDDAQIRMRMSGADLLALVAGELNLGAAWASGRVRVDATMLDLLKLRSLL